MPPKKKGRTIFDSNAVFIVTASTTREQVPRDIRNARIDSSVRVLPPGIFWYCESLKEAIFEDGTHTIGKDAFLDCRNLNKVKLPSTLKEILESAFDSCTALASVDLLVGLVVIGEKAFRRTRLMQLEIPSTVETIGKAAFQHCEWLESIALPKGLALIADFLCQNCYRLKEIEIPSTIESIGEFSFSSCMALKSLDLSHCVHCVSIAKYAFQDCSNMSFLHLAPNLQSIGLRAFWMCSTLTHVRIPPNVTSIGIAEFSPFSACVSMLSLEIPEVMESIKVIPDIAESESLVNLYLPSPQEEEEFENDPFQRDYCRLTKIAEDWTDVEAKLHHRFDGRPLHRVCYFHSYHPVEDTIEKIQSILSENPNAANEVDTLGMTPLHILSLAQKPVVSLLQELPNIAKMALESQDLFRSCPLVYLCKNPLKEGTTAARWMIRTILEKRLPFLGLERWKQELLEAEKRVRLPTDISTMDVVEDEYTGEDSYDSSDSDDEDSDSDSESNDSHAGEEGTETSETEHDDDDSDSESDDSRSGDENGEFEPKLSAAETLLYKLARCELLEALSLMEMVLWRIKLKNHRLMVEGDGTEKCISDREGCRVQCGMSIVVANVLPFLGE